MFDIEAPSWLGSSWLPSLDVSESEKELSVNLEVPGADPKDIEISLVGNKLTIQGQKKEKTEDNSHGFYRTERRFGSFRRTIELPQSVDENSITADYKNGVLTIKAHKTETAPKKRIPIAADKQH